MKRSVRAYNTEGTEVVEIYSFKREGDKLIIDGRALGVMRMDMIVTLVEVLNGLRMIFSWSFISFILLLPFFVLRHWLRSVLNSFKFGIFLFMKIFPSNTESPSATLILFPSFVTNSA